MITIYTDGSCINNPGKGGWAFILIYGSSKKEIKLQGNEVKTTNNRMEILASIKALEHLKQEEIEEEIEIFTDSNYLKNGITIWIENWIKNNWKTASKKPVLNQDLWIRLFDLTRDFQIKWNWVKAHNGNKYNEIVDSMAKQSALN